MNKALEKSPSLEGIRIRNGISPTVIAHLIWFNKKMTDENKPDLLDAGAVTLREHALKMQQAAKELRKPQPKFDANAFAVALAAKLGNDPKAAERLLKMIDGRKPRSDKGQVRGPNKKTIKAS